MKAQIRSYTPADWELLAEFIRTHWSPTHPVLDRALFDWQYRGFLTGADPERYPPALLLIDQGRLLGFLGLIFGEYQLNRATPTTEPGLALAMWMIHPDLRQAGLGLLLLKEAEARVPVVVCLGANAEAGGYYARRGYRQIPALTRWVAPLEPGAYAALCAAPPAATDITAWSRSTAAGAPQAPTAPAADALARHWRQCTRTPDGWAVQGLFRSEEFWKRRYLESTGFEYLFWGTPGDGGVLVGRIEPVFDRTARVLRLIELLPQRPGGWLAEPDESLAHRITGAMAWAARQGCVAADYQGPGSLLLPTLLRTGLRPQVQPITADPRTSLVPVFQPVTPNKPPINVYWKAPADTTDSPWYFPKSDGDMDRPHARA